MSFDDAFEALSADALRLVTDGQVLGLGSGRAAAAFVRSLSRRIRAGLKVEGVPTSLQIKLVAEKEGIPMIDADRAGEIDIAFDGADQINSRRHLIKGGGGALMRENIVISTAKKVVIMADDSKFVKDFEMPVPVEVHASARKVASKLIREEGGVPRLRTLERGYPFVTENGNVILDCDFGIIRDPESLRQRIVGLAGVMEVGLFTRKPDVIYRAKSGGEFSVI